MAQIEGRWTARSSVHCPPPHERCQRERLQFKGNNHMSRRKVLRLRCSTKNCIRGRYHLRTTSSMLIGSDRVWDLFHWPSSGSSRLRRGCLQHEAEDVARRLAHVHSRKSNQRFRIKDCENNADKSFDVESGAELVNFKWINAAAWLTSE